MNRAGTLALATPQPNPHFLHQRTNPQIPNPTDRPTDRRRADLLLPPSTMASPNSGGIPIKAEQDSDGSAQSTADMTAFVQNLLIQMQTRFQAMSENIISKNDMGARIDELELSINDLKAEMGSGGMTPTKAKDEESKAADDSA